MGREIRRVPPDWEHPRDERGRYQPLYDADFDEAEAEWVKGRELWLKHEHPEQQSGIVTMRWAEWSGQSPDPELYRERKWAPEEATAYQIYETVSEGTPISPVFKTKDEMRDWLIDQGYTPRDAQAFVKEGWVPSMTFSTSQGFIQDGIRGAANLLADDETQS